MYRKRLIATAVSIFALGVVFGIFVVEYDTFSLRAVFVSCAMLSVLYIIVSKRFNDFARSKSMMAVALAVAAFSFGVLRVSAYNLFASQTTQFDKKNDDAKFEVSEVNENYIEAYLLSSEIGVPEGELIRVYPENIPQGLVSGDGFCADVKYSVKNNNNYRANGISLMASGEITEQWDGSGVLNSIRRQVSESSAFLYEDFQYGAAISKAVSVGDRSSLDSYIYLLYKSAGISHVMSISGLHISLFAFGLYSILTIFSLRRKFACLFSSLAAVAYAALVGFNVGAVRAACMFVFVMIFRLFQRRSDGITALFISLFLLLMINPYSICSVGLQLSYMCSLGIILSQPFMSKIKLFFQQRKSSSGIVNNLLYKFLLVIITPMILSFVSSVFSFPIICTRFDSISYISVFVNIIAVPLYSYAIGFALFGFLVAPISLPIAKIISYPAGVIFDFVTNLSKVVHDAGIGNMSAHAPLIIIPVLLSIVMILALVFLSKHQIKFFTIAAVAFCVSLYVCFLMNESFIREKTVIEYSGTSGEYVYYQSHESNLYIDISGYNSVPDNVYKNGSVILDGYVVTDYDRFSLKRFDNFTGNIKVDNVYLPNPQNTYERDIYLQIKELANSRNCVIIDYNDVFSQELSGKTLIEVFTENAEYTGKLICIDHYGKRIRFVGGNYNHSVYSDVAVILKDYCANAEDIVADQTYAGVDYTDAVSGAERYFSEFEDTLRIETHNQESRFDIYEP